MHYLWSPHIVDISAEVIVISVTVKWKKEAHQCRVGVIWEIGVTPAWIKCKLELRPSTTIIEFGFWSVRINVCQYPQSLTFQQQ